MDATCNSSTFAVGTVPSHWRLSLGCFALRVTDTDRTVIRHRRHSRSTHHVAPHKSHHHRSLEDRLFFPSCSSSYQSRSLHPACTSSFSPPSFHRTRDILLVAFSTGFIYPSRLEPSLEMSHEPVSAMIHFKRIDSAIPSQISHESIHRHLAGANPHM